MPTPRALGFRMPAEWEPHEATWIAWPHNATDWPGSFAPIPWVYGEIVRKLARVERVRILVQTIGARRAGARASSRRSAPTWMRSSSSACPTDRVWTRDYGPLFVKNRDGEVALTDWRFNGWAKYDNWQRDDAVPRSSSAKRFEAARSWQPGHGARRRQHRRQRRGAAADHRGVPAQPGAGAQSRS